MTASSSTRHVTHRIALALLVSVSLLLTLSSTALAAPPTLIRETTTFAGALSDECVTEPDGTATCTYVEVTVRAVGVDWEVCVFRSVAVFPSDGAPSFSDGFGCTMVGPDSFTIDAKLAAATLDPTVVTLFVFSCDPEGNCTETTEDVTVSAAWTGVGELIRFREGYSFQQGKCRETFRGRGEARDALATITIDGSLLEADFAQLITSRSSLKISSACG
jgi:hypothetical protein